jgi:hypothetical protein
MSDSDALIEQLRRSNRRWKALALASSTALLFMLLVGIASLASQKMRAEAAMRAANEALARANFEASHAGQPR